MSNGSKDGRNYEDLKAKLGLRKTTPDPVVEPAAEPEPIVARATEDRDRTPPGGFNLGLSSAGAHSDAKPRDLEKEALARAQAAGGVGAIAEPSMGLKIAKLLLVIGTSVIAGFIGWSARHATDNKEIETKQKTDAQFLKDKLQNAAVTVQGKTQPLLEVIKRHSTLIDETAKKLEVVRNELKKVTEMSPELLKKTQADLEPLVKACQLYVDSFVRLDTEEVLRQGIFNIDALKEYLTFAKVVEDLYIASRMMAQEKAVTDELIARYDPKKLQVSERPRFWQMASVMADEKERRRIGILVPVQVESDAAGKPVFVKDAPPAPPAGQPAPPTPADPVWKVKVTYENAKQVGKESDIVSTDMLVFKDLKNDITEAVREAMGKEQDLYKALLILRELDRVDQLRMAAAPVVTSHKQAMDKLTKLAD